MYTSANTSTRCLCILYMLQYVLLTLGAHAQEGYGTCPVCCCLTSVCYHLIVDIVRFYGLPKVRAALF